MKHAHSTGDQVLIRSMESSRRERPRPIVFFKLFGRRTDLDSIGPTEQLDQTIVIHICMFHWEQKSSGSQGRLTGDRCQAHLDQDPQRSSCA